VTADLVFRQEPAGPLPAGAPPGGASFHLVAGWGGAWRARRHLRAALAEGEALRAALLRLAVPRLFFYYFLLDAHGRVVHAGRLRATRSGLAPLEGPGVVIGPIRTDPAVRGRGLATYGLLCAVNAMLARGHRRFYISASEHNVPSLRAIERAGFGAPAGRRER
jgi:GNAT superfamily N-acetyltransferase